MSSASQALGDSLFDDDLFCTDNDGALNLSSSAILENDLLDTARSAEEEPGALLSLSLDEADLLDLTCSLNLSGSLLKKDALGADPSPEEGRGAVLDGEILNMVISSLAQRDLAAVRLVSRHWKAAANAHVEALAWTPRMQCVTAVCQFPRLMTLDLGLRSKNQVDVWQYEKRVTDATMATLAAAPFAATLTSLNLEKCVRLTDEGLSALGALTALKTLSLRQCTEVTKKGLLRLTGLQRLTALDLSNCERLTDAALAALMPLTGLTTLDLSGCRWVADAGVAALYPLTALLSLDLAGCDMVTDAGVEALAALTGLESLQLSGGDLVTDAGVVALAGLPRLARLDISGCDMITDAGVASLAPLTQLASLRLAGCDMVTDRGVKALAPLTGLTSLHLSGCERLTNQGVAALVPLTSLTSLHLSYCDRVTDEGVAALTAIPGLTALNLSGCTHVTDGATESLAVPTGSCETCSLRRVSELPPRRTALGRPEDRLRVAAVRRDGHAGDPEEEYISEMYLFSGAEASSTELHSPRHALEAAQDLDI